MLNRDERIRIVVSECQKFSKIPNPEFNILNNLHDMLMNEVSSDVQNIYHGVTKDEMKEDIKILLDHINDEKNEDYKELLMEVIVKLTKLMIA